MSYGPGEGCAVTADLNRYMAEQDRRELTVQQENELQAALEDRAEDEAREGSREFQEWLCNDYADSFPAIVLHLLAWDNGESDGFALAADSHRLMREWKSYRVNTFTDAEREEVEAEVIGESA